MGVSRVGYGDESLRQSPGGAVITEDYDDEIDEPEVYPNAGFCVEECAAFGGQLFPQGIPSADVVEYEIEDDQADDELDDKLDQVG